LGVLFYLFIMENKMFVGVSVEVKDGRFFFDIMADKGLYMEDIRSILVGGVALSIRSEKTPELQAKVLKDVISHLESEFIDPDSFNDLYSIK
jgi:hypothetical protein